MSRRRQRRRASWPEAALYEKDNSGECEYHHEQTDPIAEADVQRNDVRGADDAGHVGLFVELRSQIRPAHRIDEFGDSGIRRAGYAHARFDGPENEVGSMLLRRARAAKPRIVRDVDDKLGAFRAVLARQVLKGGLVADDDTEPAQFRRVQRQRAPGGESTGPVAQSGNGPKHAHGYEGNALGHGHEIMLRVDRVRPPVPARIDENGGVVVRITPATPRGIGPKGAGEDGDMVLTHETRDARNPVRTAPEKIGNRRFGPDDQLRPRKQVCEALGAIEQRAHHAVGMSWIPFLAKSLVGLNQSDQTQFLSRQALDPPYSITQSAEHRHQHGRVSARYVPRSSRG